MTPEERDRLRTVEDNQGRLFDELHALHTELGESQRAMAKDISAIKSSLVRAGGAIVGGSSVAMFFGYMLANGHEWAKVIFGGGN